MKWFNKFKLLFRMFAQRKFVTFLLFAMSTVSFYMIDKVMTDYISGQYAIWQAENQLGCNPKDGFYVWLFTGDATEENANLIREYLKKTEVEGAGFVRYQGLGLSQLGIEELSNDNEEEQSCALIICDKSVMSLGNLKLTTEQIDMINNADKNCEPVFLGSHFKGKVDVGKVLTIEDAKSSRQVVVAGFLEKNAAWPRETGLFGASFGPNDRYNLNEGILLITDDAKDYYSGNYYRVFGVAKPDSFEQVKKDITGFAVENDIDIKVCNYGDEIADKKESSNISGDDVFIAAVLLSLLAVVSMSAASIIYCLINKRQYGIMMVNGVTRQNIIWLISMQNIITISIAAVSVWFFRQNEIFADKSMNKEQLISTFETIFRQLHIAHDYFIPVIFLLAGAVIVMASIIIPIHIIRKSTLPELLSDRS